VGLISSSLPAHKRAKRATILLVEDDPFQAFVHRSALGRHYDSIERVLDASEALIRVEEPGFEETLALIVVGLRLPGWAGPAFVNELRSRAPNVPVLAIGRLGETAADYADNLVRFLPGAPPERVLLAAVREMLPKELRQVA
jgi:CheY-like chemotaxis protein